MRTCAAAQCHCALFYSNVSDQRVESIIRGLLGNPFAIGPEAQAAAETALAKLDVARTLRDLVARNDGGVIRAKHLMLSVGHHQARLTPESPKNVLDTASVPPDVQDKLPRGVAAYRRIVMAAGRCFHALSTIRGSSAEMQRARSNTWAACFGDSLLHALDLERVIRDHDVLILGETGTGKEAFARAIQRATPGDGKGGAAPHSAVNAAAIPDTLVESELFGHVKGAFTGATETRAGRIRSSDGGCFFLDEVGDLPSTTQVKLLRVIETNEVYPLGTDTPHTVDVRYVAATHKDLEAMVDERRFRRDLFQRLAGKVIRIPPLRERPNDILEIALPFVQQYLGASIREEQLESINGWLRSSEARNYPWPGNVRELQNALRNLILGLPAGLTTTVPAPHNKTHELPTEIAECVATMQELSDWYLHRVLHHNDGNFSQTARTLGVDRSTVRRRAKTPSK